MSSWTGCQDLQDGQDCLCGPCAPVPGQRRDILPILESCRKWRRTVPSALRRLREEDGTRRSPGTRRQPLGFAGEVGYPGGRANHVGSHDRPFLPHAAKRRMAPPRFAETPRSSKCGGTRGVSWDIRAIRLRFSCDRLTSGRLCGGAESVPMSSLTSLRLCESRSEVSLREGSGAAADGPQYLELFGIEGPVGMDLHVHGHHAAGAIHKRDEVAHVRPVMLAAWMGPAVVGDT